jgi:CBS domain containing-hemolysin-like protein
LDLGAWFRFALALFFVLANGFFVAAEFAFVKVRATRLEELASRGSRRATLALAMMKDLYSYLNAAQLGITLSSLALGWFGEPAFAKLVEYPLHFIEIDNPAITHGIASALAFATITILHILFGEFVPKFLGIQKTESTVLWVALPLRFFYIFLFPIMWVLNKTASKLLPLFGLSLIADDHEHALGPEELKMVVASSHHRGLLTERTKAILERTFALNERSAKEIMVPRADTTFLSTNVDFAKNLERIAESGFTRFPLCEDGDPDRIVGIVHSREALLAARRNEEKIQSIARPPIFVPATQTADSLLQLFRRKKLHIAIVVDEYGGTLGIVTLEDVLEVLVGEIQDEFDTEIPPWQKLPDGAFSIDAGVPATDASERLHVELGEGHPATLGGLVMDVLGRVAEVGDKVELGNYQIEVTEVNKLRIIRVKATPLAPKDPPPNAPKKSPSSGGKI